MLDLTTSLASLSDVRRHLYAFLAFLLALTIAFLFGSLLGSPFAKIDAPNYLDLAAGRPVMLPFAWRQLGPLLVQTLSRLLHVSLQSAFLIEGTLALAIFLAIVLFLLIRSRAPPWVLPAITGLFFWTRQWNELASPDLTFAALLAIFVLLLSRDRILLAAATLFPLTVARESSLLVLACLLVAGWRSLRRSEIAAAFAATAAGILTVKLLTTSALPNREHLSAIVYLLAKLPINMLRNVFGVEPWANIYTVCAVPKWQIPFQFFGLQSIGICSTGPSYPMHTLTTALSSFGLLPLMLLKTRRNSLSTRDGLLRFCLLYGALSFLLAPLLGSLVGRLFDYAWPLFLVAVPLLLANRPELLPTQPAAVTFLILHLTLSWAPWWVFFASPFNLLEVDLALYCAGWWLLRHSSAPLPRPSSGPSPIDTE